ncbi:MAG: TonB-dependent receptor plug domain-containing protein [Deltaproteobacteria bacterium]|nr:TonB-dependent receptor plug domain-containing protein [Deltaproteobacteria bacterium]
MGAGADNTALLGPNAPPKQEAPSKKSDARLPEMIVSERRPTTAASSETIRARDFELRPHTTTQEILNNLPGLIAGQHAGGGKAMQYFLRGFDNDHGTDIALFVDGVPVSMINHAHGQGYADLNFLIPETVDRVEFSKGPYFVEWGDLANSGAINFITKERASEHSLQAVGGFFNTMRYTGVLSPQIGPVQTFLAGEVYFSDGPFKQPENYRRYNFFGKFSLAPTPTSKLSLCCPPTTAIGTPPDNCRYAKYTRGGCTALTQSIRPKAADRIGRMSISSISTPQAHKKIGSCSSMGVAINSRFSRTSPFFKAIGSVETASIRTTAAFFTADAPAPREENSESAPGCGKGSTWRLRSGCSISTANSFLSAMKERRKPADPHDAGASISRRATRCCRGCSPTSTSPIPILVSASLAKRSRWRRRCS